MLEVKKARAAEAGSDQPTAQYVDRMEREGRPLTLRIDDRPPLLVKNTRAYQVLWELVDRIETIEAVREGLEQMERGEGRPAQEFFEENAAAIPSPVRGMKSRIIVLPGAESDIVGAAGWIAEHHPSPLRDGTRVSEQP